MKQSFELLMSHETVEYYTPEIYTNAAREVMGSIDLDPASCWLANNQYVKAERYFSRKDDGLTKVWFGNVWLNPPYSTTRGKSSQMIWTDYLIEQYKNGNVKQAVALIKSALGYIWYESLVKDCWICLAEDRIPFIRHDGKQKGKAKHGTTFLYLGDYPDKFFLEFSKFGRVLPPQDTIDSWIHDDLHWIEMRRKIDRKLKNELDSRTD